MTQPAVEQLLNLADRAERGPLTPNEAQRLRAGILTAFGQATNPEPSWQCPDCGGLVPASQQHLHQEAEQRSRAERAEALLRRYLQLADVTHTYPIQGGHDCLGPNLTCAGCTLRDDIRAALDPQEPQP